MLGYKPSFRIGNSVYVPREKGPYAKIWVRYCLCPANSDSQLCLLIEYNSALQLHIIFPSFKEEGISKEDEPISYFLSFGTF